MSNLKAALSTLVTEYDRLDGVVTELAISRRKAVMESVTGAIFSNIVAAEDPLGTNHLDEDCAERTLAGSLVICDRMVAAMLHFRQRAEQHGYSPENYLDRLRQMLEEIWDLFQPDLLGFLDTFDLDDDLDDDQDDDQGEALAA